MISFVILMSLEWPDFVGGWVGGICSTCIAFPADTVKTRLQVNNAIGLSRHDKKK